MILDNISLIKKIAVANQKLSVSPSGYPKSRHVKDN
jgi:hypothetical protein